MAEINITHAKTDWITPVMFGVLLAIMGILIIILKAEALKWILIVSGIMAVASGIVEIVVVMKKTNVLSIAAVIEIVLGVVFIILPGLVADFLMVLLGIALCLYGALNIFGALSHKDADTFQKFLGIGIGILAIFAGVYALFNLHSTENIVMIIIGAQMILVGAIQIFCGVKVYKQFH